MDDRDSATQGRRACFIPARRNSIRVPNKNAAHLGGHPLLAYPIQTALQAQLFHDVVCVTDSNEYAEMARHYGAEVPELRPTATASSHSPDIEWIRWIVGLLKASGREPELAVILRPTSPLVLSEMVRRAFSSFREHLSAESLRGVRRVTEHPGKMWLPHGDLLSPVLGGSEAGTPWHSIPTGLLPSVYLQDASIEIFRVRNVSEYGTFSGVRIMGFPTDEWNLIDVNTASDLARVRALVRERPDRLPIMPIRPYQGAQANHLD